MTDIFSKIQSTLNCIYNIVSECTPFDELEDMHIQDTLIWLQSGSPIFRIAKPDIPNKHLVCYFVLFDVKALKILLVDHKKAQLWVPTGGHVEKNEHPKDTVERECLEELYIPADFWREDPIFITSTVTVGLAAGHIDVSLWYVLQGNHQKKYTFNKEEFNDIKWFSFDEISSLKTDVNMYRFMKKIRQFI